MNRLPLWLDLDHVSGADRAAFIAAGEAVGSERIIPVNATRANGLILDSDDVLLATVHDIAGAAGQEAAANETGRILVEARDWTIIPLENLIAARRNRPDSLYALATSAEEAGVFRDTLDVGVHGIVLRPETVAEIHLAHNVLVAKGPRPDDQPGETTQISLEWVAVTERKDAGPGDRVCIDTTQQLAVGEGALVGSTARGFALVHAETLASEFVAARPFRINAGPVHSYVLVPGGKTRYLSELAAGDSILVAGPDGERTVPVGRVKIERRPHILLAWAGGHVILQNAETIRLVTPAGPKSITELKVGDQIQVHKEHAARHFGMAVDERLVER